MKPTAKMGFVKTHAILKMVVLTPTLTGSRHPCSADLKIGLTFNNKLAVWAHTAFYFLLLGIAMPEVATMISGEHISVLQFDNLKLVKKLKEIDPLKAHGIMVIIMMTTLVMHTIGAVKRHLLTKGNVLKRILPRQMLRNFIHRVLCI